MKSNITIIILAYNEQKTIGKVIRDTKKVLDKLGKYKIIVVDDGSRDKTTDYARKAGGIVLHHRFNQGYGRATITGYLAAKRIGYPIVVTLDGDGQHDAKDIPRIIQSIIKKQADLVIGSRLTNPKGMPWVRILGNRLLSWATSVLFHQKIHDSQSGFRAIELEALKKLKLTDSGYEICSEIIGESWRNQLRLKEIPIKTIYTPYSRHKSQNIFNGINIILRSLYHLLTR